VIRDAIGKRERLVSIEAVAALVRVGSTGFADLFTGSNAELSATTANKKHRAAGTLRMICALILLLVFILFFLSSSFPNVCRLRIAEISRQIGEILSVVRH
jgi:hypothetical protein